MTVYVLEHLGKKTVSLTFGEVSSLLEDFIQAGETAPSTIYPLEMTQEEFDALPEFEGY